jgi:hypothetical protein
MPPIQARPAAARTTTGVASTTGCHGRSAPVVRSKAARPARGLAVHRGELPAGVDRIAVNRHTDTAATGERRRQDPYDQSAIVMTPSEVPAGTPETPTTISPPATRIAPKPAWNVRLATTAPLAGSISRRARQLPVGPLRAREEPRAIGGQPPICSSGSVNTMADVHGSSACIEIHRRQARTRHGAAAAEAAAEHQTFGAAAMVAMAPTTRA